MADRGVNGWAYSGSSDPTRMLYTRVEAITILYGAPRSSSGTRTVNRQLEEPHTTGKAK